VSSACIDLHCHFIPPLLLDRIASEGERHSVRLESGDRVSFAGKDTTQPMPNGMVDLEQRLRWMDDQGIDLQILSAWMDFSAYVLEPEDGAWLARALNELTQEAISAHPDRFRAMAAVPLQAPELAARELRYAIEELGMVAVEIATNVVDAELDHPSLAPFWRAAEELDLLVLVHPYSALGSERLGRYFLSNIVGNPAEETVAAANLIFGGVLERHPKLKVCLTHGGGFLPYGIGRQDRGFEALSGLTARQLSAPPSTHLRRFYYDTIVHDVAALRFLVERVGADRVVLGSDYPFPMGDPKPVASVREAGLEDRSTRAVLEENAVVALGRNYLGREKMMHSFLAHDVHDDVAVAVRDVEPGPVVIAYLGADDTVTVESREGIPLGHKMALREMDEGETVVEYGLPIGRTTKAVPQGAYVHTHNLRTARW
jgi:aminocarboxymuconate-semialdehyde decarboxylase